MNSELKLNSPIPPSVNHYLSYRVVKTKNNKTIASSYKTKEAKKYQSEFEQYVKQEVQKQGWDINSFQDKHLYVDTIFYFPRKDMDCNNYFKVMLDAITNTQMVWADDNIVCERVNQIYYNSKNPHIEISIHPVSYIGIFDNNDRLQTFENRCKGCSRYARNCSLLNRAKAGYVQEGITQEMCGYCKPIKDTHNKSEIIIIGSERINDKKEK